ncbi:MAG: DMT family transporter [Pseudomonadota bacterium]
MTRSRANAMLLAISVIWGLAFIFQKTAMDHMGPLLFVALRCLVATVVLAPLAWLEGRRSSTDSLSTLGALSPIAAFSGVMFFLGAGLQQIGLVTATVTNTGFITGLYVVITPILAWAAFRVRPLSHVWGAAALAFIGTWFLGGGTVGGFSTGDMLVAISAIFWAAHMVVIEASSKHARPITFTAIQFAVTGAIAFVFAFAFETVSWEAIQAAWTEILFVGVLSSALTFTLLAVAMRHAPSTDAAILVAMETVFAALAAAILLGERLSPIGWGGAAMMFAATLIVQLVPGRRSVGAGGDATPPAPPSTPTPAK